MFEYTITDMTFSGGETVPVEKDSLIILIGPNNCGKSHTLRDISEQVRLNLHGITSKSNDYERRSALLYAGHQFRAVTSVSSIERGKIDELRSWLAEHYPFVNSKGDKKFVTSSSSRSSSSHELTEDSLMKVRNFAEISSKLGEFLIRVLDTKRRIELANSVDRIDVNDTPQYPIHILQRNADLA